MLHSTFPLHDLLKLALFAFLRLAISACQTPSSTGTIHTVASAYYQAVYLDDLIEAFIIELPPEAHLAAHQTQQRVLLTLSPISVERLSSNNTKPIHLPVLKALWLENTHSGAIKNISDQTARYLVIQAREPIKDLNQSNTCHALISPELLHNSYIHLSLLNRETNASSINSKLQISPYFEKPGCLQYLISIQNQAFAVFTLNPAPIE